MGANDSDTVPDGDEFAQDKHIKKTLLIDTITKECASSSHNILQKINEAIGAGETLEATVLSGGYTNYSYKVYVDNDDPELQVFAKLSFEYALWNPDKSAHYDLKRTENEHEIMKTISSKSPGSVVEPLALLDLKHEDQNMKLLVTEWSKADEQFCNQFIDGSVDPRIAQKLADTLASLHTIQDFDPSFNETVKPCMENLFSGTFLPVSQAASKSDNPKDRTEGYCKELGEEKVLKIVNASIEDYHKRDCLIHSDSHAFNTLVEAKPSIELLEEFGPNGAMVLCDWEMAMAGPKGRDAGLALSFPIGCLIAHALNGQTEANESIEVFINGFIDAYLARMAEAGKSSEEVAAILRNVIGWSGWFQYLAFYMLNVQMESFPVETEEKIGRLRDANGILGLKFLQLSYDTDYLSASAGIDDIRKKFDSLIEEEVTRGQDLFASFRRKKQPRKSSMLRASNRRLSDTEMLFLAAESVRRLSIAEDAKA